MKMLVKRIETIDKKGKKSAQKGGGSYHIDGTTLICDVPFDQEKDEKTNDDDYEKSISFGVKEMSYQVGAIASNKNYKDFDLERLRGQLPAMLDVELGQGTNQWGQPQTVVTDIKIPQAKVS